MNVVFKLNISRLFLVRQKPQHHVIFLHLVIAMLLGEDYKFTESLILNESLAFYLFAPSQPQIFSLASCSQVPLIYYSY